MEELIKEMQDYFDFFRNGLGHAKDAPYNAGYEMGYSHALNFVKNHKPPIPYGDWLTGNVDLLESLPEGTELHCKHKNQKITSRFTFIKKDNYWAAHGGLFDTLYTNNQIYNLFIYFILRPIPTESK